MSEKQLHDRWQELVVAVKQECWKNRQNPEGGILDADESALKVSLPLKDSRYPHTFTESEILNGGDHRELARSFYQSYKSACNED